VPNPLQSVFTIPGRPDRPDRVPISAAPSEQFDNLLESLASGGSLNLHCQFCGKTINDRDTIAAVFPVGERAAVVCDDPRCFISLSRRVSNGEIST
jgi:hypothetical protein